MQRDGIVIDREVIDLVGEGEDQKMIEIHI